MISQYSTRVLLDGVEYPHKSVTWSGQAGNDLPGRLAISTGFSQRTAKVVWEEPEVVGQGWNPWDNDYPSPGRHAEIFVTLDSITTKVFTGKIDTTDTSVYGETSSSLVDYSDDLSKIITLYALLYNMPGRNDSPNKSVRCEVSPSYQIHRILRECGYSTDVVGDAPGNGLIFYAPLLGSFWTSWERGEGALYLAQLKDTPAIAGPAFNVTAEGPPVLGRGYAKWNGIKESMGAKQVLYMSIQVGADHTGTASFTITTGIYGTVTLQIGGRNAYYKVNDQTVGSPLPLPAKKCVVALEVANNTSTLWVWGETNKVTINNPAVFTNNSIDHFQIHSIDRSAVAYAVARVLDFRPSTYNGAGVEPIYSMDKRARINLFDNLYGNSFLKSIRSESAINVLQDYCKKTCSLMWYDADGVLNIEYAARARAKAATNTVEVASMMDAPVKSDTLMTASEVQVKGMVSHETRSKGDYGAAVTLWQGSGTSLAANEVVEFIISIPEDQDWHEIDSTFARDHNNTGDIGTLNAQDGSVYFTTMAGDWWGDNIFKFEQITPFVFKATCSAPLNPISLKVPSGTPGVTDIVKGQNTPILRGGALTTYTDGATYSVTTDATNAPILEHDMGEYGTGDATKTFVKELAKHCTKRNATYLRQIKHFFNPKLDVGQVVDLDLTQPYGKKFRALILGISQDPGNNTTTLTVRPFQELDGYSYGDLANSNNTYETIEQNKADYTAAESK